MGVSDRIPACYGAAEGDRLGHGQWPTGPLCDVQIRHLAQHHKMIEPFEPHPVREVTCAERASVGVRKVVSFGTTSYGYDIRVSNEFKVFTPVHCAIVDPKEVDSRSFQQMVVEEGAAVMVPPNSFVLARSIEHFNIPRDVLAIVLGKSTYARCGLVVNCTPLEPEWRGHLTIEISNTTPLPAKVYACEGIAQVVFFKASQPCITSYQDKGGKYQDQPAEVVTARM